MYAGVRDIDGVSYLFNKNGALVESEGWVDLPTISDTYKSWGYSNGSTFKKNEWFLSGGKWYYFDSNGETVVSDSLEINNKNYLFNEKGQLVYNEWVKIKDPYDYGWFDSWKLSDGNGITVKDSWKYIAGHWYYFSGDQMVTYPMNIGGKVYTFAESGKMNTGTGWVKTSNSNPEFKWNYIVNDVALSNQWKMINGKWYHFDEDGYLSNNYEYEYELGKSVDVGVTDKKELSVDPRYPTTIIVNLEPKIINGKKYVFDHNGAMASDGWIRVVAQDIDTWSYYKNGSFIKNEWLKSNGKWYYFDFFGQMLKGESDHGYSFNEDGSQRKIPGWYQTLNRYNTLNWTYMDSRLNPAEDIWKKINNKWYYFDYYGAMKTLDYVYNPNGDYYLVDANGVLAENKWVTLSNDYYDYWTYGDSNGIIATGWKKINGKEYYFKDYWGEMLVGNHIIDGSLYIFDETGALIK